MVRGPIPQYGPPLDLQCSHDEARRRVGAAVNLEKTRHVPAITRAFLERERESCFMVK